MGGQPPPALRTNLADFASLSDVEREDLIDCLRFVRDELDDEYLEVLCEYLEAEHAELDADWLPELADPFPPDPGIGPR